MGSTGLDTGCGHWEPQVASAGRNVQTDTHGSHSKVQFLEVTLNDGKRDPTVTSLVHRKVGEVSSMTGREPAYSPTMVLQLLA